MLITPPLTFFLIVLSYASSQSAKVTLPSTMSVTSSLEDIQSKFGKRYTSEEQKVFRRVILQRNKREINNHNKKSTRNFNLGQNQFIDLTPEQFTRRFKGLIPSTPSTRQYVADYTAKKQIDDQKCYCSVDLAFKKIDLQKKLSKNQQQYSNSINNNLLQIQSIDNKVNASIQNIKRIIYPSITNSNSLSSKSSILSMLTPSKNTNSVLPKTIQDPLILQAMSPILQKNSAPLLSSTSSQTLVSINTTTGLINLDPSLISNTALAPSSYSSLTTTTVYTKSSLTDVDWTSKTGPVRHQGICGACYALTTVQVLQSCNSIFLFNGLYIQLSSQQILDCAVSNYNGCNGGLLQWGFSFMQTAGVTSNFRYPYISGTTGTSSSCKIATGQFKILSYRQLNGTCSDLRKQLQIKPVATAVKSARMQFYSGGVFDNCTYTDYFDHAVVVVAFNSTLGWKFKNTWGTTWGENGYGWLSLDQSKNCGVCDMPVVPQCRGQPSI